MSEFSNNRGPSQSWNPDGALRSQGTLHERVVSVQPRSSCDIGLLGCTGSWWLSAGELYLVLSDSSSQFRFLSIEDDLKRKKKKRDLFSSGVTCDVLSLGQPSESQFILRMSQCRLWFRSSCCLAYAAADIPHVPKVSALGTSDTRRSEKVREAAHKHCTLVQKGISQGGQVKLSDAGVCGLQWIHHLNAGQAGELGVSLSEGGLQISQVGRVGWSPCPWITGNREASTNSRLTEHRRRHHRQQYVQSHGYTRNTKQQRAKILSAVTNCQHSQKNIF